MLECVTQVKDKDVSVSFMSDYPGWYRSDDDKQWGGEIADPKERVFEAQLATLADQGVDVGDGKWNEELAEENRTTSTSGRVTEDEDLGGITGPERRSSESSSS